MINELRLVESIEIQMFNFWGQSDYKIRPVACMGCDA